MSDNDTLEIDFGSLKKRRKKVASLEEPTRDDYDYAFLLNRVMASLESQNTTLVLRSAKTSLQAPRIHRTGGGKKTTVTNFSTICYEIKRKPDHVMNYIAHELGAFGSIDGNGCLVLRGRFSPTVMETIIRKYIHEYVACKECKSLGTTLERDRSARLSVVKCALCTSERRIL